jgi:hypothetical protein
MSISEKRIRELVELHLNHLIADVQAELGVTSGDVAGQHFSGPREWDEVVDDLTKRMERYVAAEEMYK